LYERLNNLLDDRGDPRLPFEIYAINAAAEGIYIVVEVHGHRRPHMSQDGRYHIRRNLRVRQMTEAEVTDAYRQRFERERGMVAPAAADRPEPAARIRRGLDEAELAAYQQETGDEKEPGWLSVWAIPRAAPENLLDPRRFNGREFRELQIDGLWREHPLQYMNPRKTLNGFVAQLPAEGGYPHYFVRLWSDGLLEFGDLQAPVVRQEDPARNRIIPTHAIAEYVHDFLLLAQAVFAYVGYDGEVTAGARLDNVEGYRLAVNPRIFLRGDLSVGERSVESDSWRGPARSIHDGASEVAHDISDKVFIAAGQENGAYFFDNQGNYTGGR
jgi:hypothetical protein